MLLFFSPMYPTIVMLACGGSYPQFQSVIITPHQFRMAIKGGNYYLTSLSLSPKRGTFKACCELYNQIILISKTMK